MSIKPLSLRTDYWDTYQISESDLEFLYNHLLEIETPQTSVELVHALVAERIRAEKSNLTQQQDSHGTIYRPKDHYQAGQKLSFPALDWQQGQVHAVRSGSHPEFPPFEVIEVQFAQGDVREFASGIENHQLNQPIAVQLNDPQLDQKNVLDQYGDSLTDRLNELLEANADLVRIAGRWFPRSLLVDVSQGHLNLAEAVLDMAGGGPLTAHDLLEQIDLPTDVNSKLTEFSLNLALQEDSRFDEVGPAGEIIWFLHRLEPEAVQNIPGPLKFNRIDYDTTNTLDLVKQIDRLVVDELEAYQPPKVKAEEMTLALIYPHWRAGTLPLTKQVSQFFPTAYEAPRVQFTFVDGNSGERYSGWVIRPFGYIYGLREWYSSINITPGGLITIKRGKNPGEVIITANKHRSTREWIRTAIIGADNGIVFATLKQNIFCSYDERMAISIPDQAAVDSIWEQTGRARGSLEQTIVQMMRVLSKLNPQGHVHLQELYSSVNLVRRCPPGLILYYLVEKKWARHLGDLYFRLEEDIEDTP